MKIFLNNNNKVTTFKREFKQKRGRDRETEMKKDQRTFKSLHS